MGSYIHISSPPCSSCAHLEEGGEVGHLDPSLPYHGNVLFHVVKWPKIGHRPPLTENKVIPLTLSVKNILGPHIPLKYIWHNPPPHGGIKSGQHLITYTPVFRHWPFQIFSERLSWLWYVVLLFSCWYYKTVLVRNVLATWVSSAYLVVMQIVVGSALYIVHIEIKQYLTL